jgi:thioredoxin 1
MIEVNNQDILAKEIEKNRKVLALFYASWCPYCQGFVKSFDKKIVNYQFDLVMHVNMDDYDNPLWDDYSIEAVPTVILFETGQVSDRLDGRSGVGLNEEQLEEWLKKLKQ